MGKEAYDDYKRHLRDREANSQKYLIFVPPQSPDSGPHTRSVPSSSLRVGDLVVLEKNQRVPADMVLLRTSDPAGTCFIRTDQLDGETDWKLRIAVPATQKIASDKELMVLNAEVYGRFSSLSVAMELLPGPFSDAQPLSRCSGQGYPYFCWYPHYQSFNVIFFLTISG